MRQVKRLLVTGGAGFIGANFIDYVLKQQESIELVNVDKLTYAANLANLQTWQQDRRYTFIQADILDTAKLEKVLKDFQIDTIVHFAAESHVDRSIQSPFNFIKSNVLGTQTLLDACKKHWQQRAASNKSFHFHHISTDEIFGSLRMSDAAFTEGHPYEPRSPYAASKASSNHLVAASYHTFGLPITISNCSNNYGPYQHAEKFIPAVIANCLSKKPIPVYGNGQNIRDWLYVEDHCKAIMAILTKGEVGEQYNIGGENEWENLPLATTICELINEIMPSKFDYRKLIEFVPDRLGHDFRYAINNQKIKTALGWQPRIAMRDGLSKTVQYYMDVFSKNITT